MLSCRLSLRISPALERRIRQHVRSIGKRPSVVVREVLEQHFAEDRCVLLRFGASGWCHRLCRECSA